MPIASLMSLLEWDDSFSIGIKTADAHHKKIINMIGSLHEAMLEGKTQQVIEKILDELLEYTNYHFEYEEKLLIQHSYPDFETHKKEHLELANQVQNIRDKFNLNNSNTSIELMLFLKKLASEHILESDKKFGVFLNSKGIK